MRTATYRTSSYRGQAGARSRLVSTVLACGIAALLLLALLRMGGVIPRDFGDRRPLSTFDIASRGDSEEKASTRRTVQTRRAERRAEAKVAPPRPPVEAPPLPEPPLHLPGVLILSRQDYAASDIGTIKGTAPVRSADAGAGAGAGDGSGEDSASIGAGPGGEPLYAAEWYREPRRAEMITYMPAGKVGWGMVACRTAPRFRVEDCRELGESPGSGIARGLRQAAWQFLVRPPRKGGQPMIGVWVRIRFDLTASPDRNGGG